MKTLRSLYEHISINAPYAGATAIQSGERSIPAAPCMARLKADLDDQRSCLNRLEADMDGRRFRLLNVVDDFTRECLASVLGTSLSGVRVLRELDRLWRCV